MGCSSCMKNKSSIPPNQGLLQNLKDAAIEQPDKIKWFKDGLTGLIKCITSKKKYNDNQIIENRKICANCPHSTEKSMDARLTMKSQCMAKDPKTGAPCGCFLICKTQIGECPLGKWTPLTISP